jgi:hypothetical protein
MRRVAPARQAIFSPIAARVGRLGRKCAFGTASILGGCLSPGHKSGNNLGRQYVSAADLLTPFVLRLPPDSLSRLPNAAAGGERPTTLGVWRAFCLRARRPGRGRRERIKGGRSDWPGASGDWTKRVGASIRPGLALCSLKRRYDGTPAACAPRRVGETPP